MVPNLLSKLGSMRDVTVLNLYREEIRDPNLLGGRMMVLRVVRVQGALRERHELAMCISGASTCDSCMAIFTDREVSCPVAELGRATDVDETSIQKAYVYHTVKRDVDELSARLPEYGEVRPIGQSASCAQPCIHTGGHGAALCVLHSIHTGARQLTLLACCAAQLFDGIRDIMATTKPLHETADLPKRTKNEPINNQSVSAAGRSIDVFITAASKPPYASKMFRKRLATISTNVAPYRTQSRSLNPSGWSKTAPVVRGLSRLNLDDEKSLDDVVALCKDKSLGPPSPFVITNCFHYGKYDCGNLVTYLSLSVMKLNRRPGSICISIDIAASIDPHHSMSIAIDSLKNVLRKRGVLCTLFAQVSRTPSARAFWKGKLTATKRASVMAVLLSTFDDRYLIYEDTDDMALFYDD